MGTAALGSPAKAGCEVQDDICSVEAGLQAGHTGSPAARSREGEGQGETGAVIRLKCIYFSKHFAIVLSLIINEFV